MAINEMEFKQALSAWASGVTVVTTQHEGKVYGLTVSSFSSLSLEPQRVLVCIMIDNHLERMARASGVFAINVLSEGQEDLSSMFAVSGRDPVDQYDGAETAITGSPLFPQSLGQIDCNLIDAVEAGDHFILIGEPVYATLDSERKPLMYYSRGYRSLVLD